MIHAIAATNKADLHHPSMEASVATKKVPYYFTFVKYM